VSTARIYVTSWLSREDGKVRSSVYYRKIDDAAWYLEDPNRNPNAKPYAGLGRTAIHLPLLDVFDKVFLACAELLKSQRGDGMDAFRRPVPADEDVHG